ncbi:MAG TPA: laccase domain-containing protein [Candidatus Avidesulfovibrio excrementigallinarum]|nr:laccase domain-containing protein [Candidatus Avidesulfovibrio excrementigallinarum]
MAAGLIPFVFPGVPGVRCAFQTRIGGVSPAPWDSGNVGDNVGDDPARVAANKQALRETLGLEGMVALNQVHGTVMHFDPDNTDATPEGDGLATTRPGLGLLIRTADCQPVLLAHAGGRHVAALHVGWRGNRLHFPELAVEAFCRRYDLLPKDLYAVRGPSLGPSCAEFVNFDDEWGEAFEPWHDASRKTMDLWRLTADQFRAAGVPAAHCFGLDLCTYLLPELFFSYRRSGQTGRQGSVIWIEA